jgi:hypothetical protein
VGWLKLTNHGPISVAEYNCRDAEIFVIVWKFRCMPLYLLHIAGGWSSEQMSQSKQESTEGMQSIASFDIPWKEGTSWTRSGNNMYFDIPHTLIHIYFIQNTSNHGAGDRSTATITDRFCAKIRLAGNNSFTGLVYIFVIIIWQSYSICVLFFFHSFDSSAG